MSMHSVKSLNLEFNMTHHINVYTNLKKKGKKYFFFFVYVCVWGGGGGGG